MRAVLIATAVLALVAAPMAAQQNFDNVQIKATHVAGNVHMLEGAGGNIGVSAGEDGVLIIDDQFAPLADKIKAAVAGIQSGGLDYVLNTHWHGDHTGSNAILGLEATIVAHTNVRKRLSTTQTMRGSEIPASPKSAWPVITFDDSLSIHFNGERVMVRHSPAGHTDGDSMIFFADSNVLHMGDHFFVGRFPFVDIGSGGTVKGMAANVARVLEVLPEGAKIIPGHGPLAGRGELETYHRMLTDSIATLQKAIDGGKTVEQAQAAGLSSDWDGWGSGFINQDVWIQTVYTSLSQ
ncbi:MAG: MBL fold metallo-hydrolase [Acidobacteriota bacterium]|nr:MBL fold metallo-hydrolase [Acidobacteriota bacterium]